MNFKPIATMAVVLVIGCSTIQSNDGIFEKPFTIAGGEKIFLKISQRGAMPAENQKIKISAAAIIIGKKEKGPFLVWSFGFRSKTTDKISRVMVENVFPGQSPALFVNDQRPEFKWENNSENGEWMGQVTNGDPENSPWLKSTGTSEFVFRFTVFFEDGTRSILYQLATFSEDTKQYFLKHTEQIRKNANNSSTAIEPSK